MFFLLKFDLSSEIVKARNDLDKLGFAAVTDNTVAASAFLSIDRASSYSSTHANTIGFNSKLELFQGCVTCRLETSLVEVLNSSCQKPT